MKKEKKVLEYALLRCRNSNEPEELHHLKWDSIIANDMLVLEECADETTIRKAVKESLTAKFPLLGVNDFEFVKVHHKAISTLQLGVSHYSTQNSSKLSIDEPIAILVRVR